MKNKEEARQKILDLVGEYYANYHPNNNSIYREGDKINYAGRFYGQEEMINLVDSALEFWLTHGRFNNKFEQEFSQTLGVKYCALVNSGSSANLLAFMALTSPDLGDRCIKRGDEVITVAAGFPTTVAPIIQYGACPVFLDVDLTSCNVKVEDLEKAFSPRTKAVMLAHTLGNPFDIDEVIAFCKKYNLWLIEDNCDALGSTYRGRFTGTFGDLSTSSFYPPHHITTGEGGAVYSSCARLKRIVFSLRDWGRDCWCDSGKDNTCRKRFSKKYGDLPEGYDHKYVYSHFGYNLKATDMQGAIGLAQLARLTEFTRRRKQNYNILYDGLKDLEDCVILPQATKGSDPSWFGFLLTLRNNERISRNNVTNYLEQKNIQTRNLFAGNLTKHPCFSGLKINEDYKIIGKLGNTDKIMRDSFWVGVSPGLDDSRLDYMVSNIRKSLGA